MGMDFYVHVGPFVRAPRVNVVSQKTATVCSANQQHVVLEGARFCPICGLATVAEVHPVSRSAVARPPEIDGRPEWDDMMAFVGEGALQFWVPNRQGFGVNLSETGNSSPQPLSPQSLAEALDAFLAEYDDYLKAAGEKLGVPLVVEYGVVPYFS